ncbi:hypothetical protein FO519_004996 [Halicephalobus sp. NKZ332]|nr:hypothetical protein FO519_004996 [Halicephalobus sp. NKZ332]
MKFELGTNPGYLKSLNSSVQKFDWSQHEHFLNTFKQHRTEVEGINIHFFRHNFPEKKGQQKIPLLLIHGFGSSSWDFYKIIPVLANPRRFGFDFGPEGKQIVFDVIVPSIPGFGLSGSPSKQGLGAIEVARIFGKLMKKIGNSKYFVHGSGELGGRIASIMGVLDKNVMGIHLANPFLNFEEDWILKTKWILAKIWPSGFEEVKKKDIPRSLDEVEDPDSVGIGLEASSVALTSFLLNRWAKGINHPNWRSHSQGGLQSHNTVDELLTESYIYWIFGNSANCLRVLFFTKSNPLTNVFERASVKIPVGILTTPRTPYIVPRFFYEQKFKNIVHFFEAEAGGEFVSIENPDLLAKEIFSFVELVLN